MTTLPAPLLRGLTVIAIGGALAISHIAFASAAPKPAQIAATSVVSKVDVTTTGSINSGEELGENCYIELVQERSARGKTLTRRVHECD